MRKFIAIVEAAQTEFRVSNPGGQWLIDQQEDAATSRDPAKIPATSRVTGYFTTPLMLPSEFVNSIPGARGEDRKPGDAQYDRLLKRVRENGFDLDHSRAGLIGINHLGDAYILEGNTRAAVAVATGVTHIPFDVRYFNGGEAVDGPYSPDRIRQL